MLIGHSIAACTLQCDCSRLTIYEPSITIHQSIRSPQTPFAHQILPAAATAPAAVAWPTALFSPALLTHVTHSRMKYSMLAVKKRCLQQLWQYAQLQAANRCPAMIMALQYCRLEQVAYLKPSCLSRLEHGKAGCLIQDGVLLLLHSLCIQTSTSSSRAVVPSKLFRLSSCQLSTIST